RPARKVGGGDADVLHARHGVGLACASTEGRTSVAPGALWWRIRRWRVKSRRCCRIVGRFAVEHVAHATDSVGYQLVALTGIGRGAGGAERAMPRSDPP